jgi:hypothetical protein
VDGDGNVFVTGIFTGEATFGNTVLTSQGASDLFVAKYVPSTNTWAWARNGGGRGNDAGYGIAVSGGSVYITGSIQNDIANTNNVVFTGGSAGDVPLSGASVVFENDIVVAKYTDNGASATLNWTQVGGGTGADQGQAIAVSGSNVYVTGFITNNTSNSNAVVFGGTGITVGTAQQNGASSLSDYDLVVAKYTDNGASATLGWTQVAGGTGEDFGYGIAANGTNVYITGYVNNDVANSKGVVFGGGGAVAGTFQQNGASSGLSNDIIVAKYTDNGASAAVGWTQVAGGTSQDAGYGIAVSGTSVYVTGNIVNDTQNTNGVVFGGTGTTLGTLPQYGASGANSKDIVVAKYTDNGTSATVGWTQVGGGTFEDAAFAIAVKGTSVFVTGLLTNSTANSNNALFGGSGTTAGTTVRNGATATSSFDVVVAKYIDNGASAELDWTQVAGGASDDSAFGVAIGGQQVYVSGYVTPAASFGPFTISEPSGVSVSFLSQLSDPALPLPVELVRFSATATGPAAVRLAWATASEKNSAYFQVERSLDGVAFTKVGRVVAAGNSTATHTYAFTDAALPAGTATLYYRLHQVDLDGSFSYSPVRSVAVAGATAKLVVYPNPMHAVATLVGAAPATSVQVLNAVGKLVWRTKTDEVGAAQLTLPAGLPAGIYLVRAGSQATRLVVQ